MHRIPHHLPCLIIHLKCPRKIVVCNVDPFLPAEVPPHLAIIHLPIVPNVEGEGEALRHAKAPNIGIDYKLRDQFYIGKSQWFVVTKI